MNKLLTNIIISIIAVILLWIGVKKFLNWHSKFKLVIYAILIYCINLIVLLLITLSGVGSIFHTNEEIVIMFLVGIPIYTLLLIPLNLYLLKQEKLSNTDRLFRKLQALFELVLILLTFSLILVTLTSLISKSLQMDVLIYIILIYLPVIPIMGSLKIKNA